MRITSMTGTQGAGPGRPALDPYPGRRGGTFRNAVIDVCKVSLRVRSVAFGPWIDVRSYPNNDRDSDLYVSRAVNP
jgi:hypothetical protein